MSQQQQILINFYAHYFFPCMDKVHFGSGAICAFGTKAKGYKSFVLNKHITAKNLPYA